MQLQLTSECYLKTWKPYSYKSVQSESLAFSILPLKKLPKISVPLRHNLVWFFFSLVWAWRKGNFFLNILGTFFLASWLNKLVILRWKNPNSTSICENQISIFFLETALIQEQSRILIYVPPTCHFVPCLSDSQFETQEI